MRPKKLHLREINPFQERLVVRFQTVINEALERSNILKCALTSIGKVDIFKFGFWITIS